MNLDFHISWHCTKATGQDSLPTYLVLWSRIKTFSRTDGKKIVIYVLLGKNENLKSWLRNLSARCLKNNEHQLWFVHGDKNVNSYFIPQEKMSEFLFTSLDLVGVIHDNANFQKFFVLRVKNSC